MVKQDFAHPTFGGLAQSTSQMTSSSSGGVGGKQMSSKSTNLNSLGFSFSFDLFFHFQRLWMCLCYHFPSYLSPSVTWATTLSSPLQQKSWAYSPHTSTPAQPSYVTQASCLSCLRAPGSVTVEWEWQYLFMGTFWTLNATMYTDFLLCLSPGRTKQMQCITMLISFYGCYRVWPKEFYKRNWGMKWLSNKNLSPNPYHIFFPNIPCGFCFFTIPNAAIHLYSPIPFLTWITIAIATAFQGYSCSILYTHQN